MKIANETSNRKRINPLADPLKARERERAVADTEKRYL